LPTTVEKLIAGYGPDFPSLEDLFGLYATEAQELALSQPSPALGRYLKEVAFMSEVTSGRNIGLIRFHVLIERFIALSDELTIYSGIHRYRKVVHSLTDEDKKQLRELAKTSADIIRAEGIERFTEHDTAAAGDYLKLLVGREMPHLESMIEGIAFADTSEDTMGPTFGLIGNQLVYGYFIPHLLDFMSKMMNYIVEVEKKDPLVLPGLTHEQAAEPTTFGKKIMTSLKSIDYHIERMSRDGQFIPFTGKLGGAIGNLTTHYAAYPDIDWLAFAERYITGLGLTYDSMTFQSVTYDVEISLFTEIAHMLTHIIKMAEDFLSMASCPGQMFIKRKKKGTKGSSIMPGKSNGWATEGAIAMLKEARAGLFNLAQTLPDYRHEGNMGRSYLCRNLGTGMMPAFIAIHRIDNEIVGDMQKRGYVPNTDKIRAFFFEYPGMAGSAIQTVLKRAGIEGDAYRQIESISINPDGTYANAEQFGLGLRRVIAENDLPESVGVELLKLVNPENNTGKADFLAQRCKMELRCRIQHYREKMLPRCRKFLI